MVLLQSSMKNIILYIALLLKLLVFCSKKQIFTFFQSKQYSQKYTLIYLGKKTYVKGVAVTSCTVIILVEQIKQIKSMTRPQHNARSGHASIRLRNFVPRVSLSSSRQKRFQPSTCVRPSVHRSIHPPVPSAKEKFKIDGKILIVRQ